MKSKKLLPHQEYIASLNKPFKEHTKEERLEYLRLYRLTNSEKNKEYHKEYSKEYRSKNSEKLKEYHKEHRKKYWLKNSEKLKEYNKEFRKRNPEYHDEYRLKNKEYLNKYCNERYHHDSEFRKRCLLRNWLNASLRRKSECKESWIKHVGCSKDDFIKHIEEQLNDGMSWNNWSRNGWHLDHIIPLSKGGTNHYSNIQPLWAIDNLKKSNKLII